MSAFNKVAAFRPGRSVFNLSYQKQFDCDFGELIPVTLEEMVPGDTFKFGNEIVANFHPMVAPPMAEINAYVHYFFVPTRLVFDKWEDFITGGEDGDDATVLPRMGFPNFTSLTAAQKYGKHSLYDYFGFPLIVDGSSNQRFPGDSSAVGTDGYQYRPLAFPWYVYNLVWNEYYRDETLQDEVYRDNPFVLHRNWNKDYFTSALPWQQRGTTPALPLAGVGSAVWDDDIIAPLSSQASSTAWADISQYRAFAKNTGAGVEDVSVRRTTGSGVENGYLVNANISKTDLNDNTIDMSNVATFDVSDLRLAFQVQKWMERNARSGVRYTEFLHAHYGVSPRDDRLQRPEYLGGSKSPILVSQVVQTSESGTTPQGTLRGKGMTADKNYIGSYTAKEFGYLIGMMSIMPKPGYFQGVDRKWLRNSKFDFYFPEFAHLSEQAVTNEEIFAQRGNEKTTIGGVSLGNGDIFGYQARFNEMRQNHDLFCGELRPNESLGYWNLGRYFDSLPQLNSDFITMNASNDHLKRVFAVQNVKGVVVNFANIITAIRPIPKYGEPGLIDHN